MLHTGEQFTKYYNIPHFSSLQTHAVQSPQPSEIKVGLRPHQKAVIHRMIDLESKLQGGYDICGEYLYSNFGILGDSVGVGKSLMVLGQIAALKSNGPSNEYKILNQTSTKNLYSLLQAPQRDLSNCPALLVVPHTLFRQWQEYIQKQTTLKAYLIKGQKTLKELSFFSKLCTSDLVLVSNTILGSFVETCYDRIFFLRTYFDEADSIYISSTKRFPQTGFVWFITASWQNVVFENDRVWMSHGNVQRLTSSPTFSTLDTLFQAQMINSLVSGRGYFNRYTSRSPLYFKDYMRSQHPLRTHLVIKCSESFIAESISLPPLFSQTILCEPSVSQRIIGDTISQQIQDLLHAGDVPAALHALGVPAESPISLIEAVTENRMKELDRLKKTYEFKSSIEYSTPQLKEQALANLKGKITSLEEQVQTIQQRIQNYSKEICAICFDEPTGPVLTPCCSRIFCAGCILMSVSRMSACPMCRATMVPANLRSVSEKGTVQEKKQPISKGPPKKFEALFDLIRKNPSEKFLVFSRYENPFRMMQEKLEAENIKVQMLKGNKDVIHSMIEKFDQGEIRVLLLNSVHTGSGLNITSANYVVLWHAMTQEEENQILGRAYRMGRTGPLHFVKLVHPDEVRS